MIKVGAIQTKNRTFSYKSGNAAQALRKVRANLDQLTELAARAAADGCHIAAFPEDTLGTLEWEAGHWDDVAELLEAAEAEMLQRFRQVAAAHQMAIICCNDCVACGQVYNTAILIGADGQERGRYRKVQPPLAEGARGRGSGFPVFSLPDVGTVGMCICYDMVFPETTRALALGGADIVFHSTLGGASLASQEASLAAFRTRAAENYIYIVVAFRGAGSMIISPKGEILAADNQTADTIIAAEIDLQGGRDAGDALGGITTDFRARLFRERNPAAYGILTDPQPPVLEKLRDVPVPSVATAAALFAEGLTTGADAFYEAETWLRNGRLEEARRRFEELIVHFDSLWIGRAARDRLTTLMQKQNPL